MRAPIVAGPLLVAAAAVGCAQPATPPGGEVDRVPPRVIEVTPAAFDTLTDLGAPVVIRFDERLSERLQGVRDWEEAVLVSPVTSPVRVDAGRRELQISLARGWEPDRVYRVVVSPVFQDLFGNRRVEPIHLVFSTGAPIPDAALAGFVRDRLTGRAAPDARVEAVRRIDGTPYIARTDTAGFFAMQFMPAGAYDVRAWLDQNRDRARDPFEPQDSLDVVFGVGDTAVVELGLLRPDTTPARLARAQPIDSTKVRLVFDDYFPPGPTPGEALLYALPDTTFLARHTLLHGSRLDSLLAAEARTAEPQDDALAVPDTAGPEEMEEPGRAPPLQEARPIAGRTSQRADGPPLPSQELILVAPGLLRPDSAYWVRVEGVTNIHGIGGGGGATSFVMPPAPPPDTVPADTVPADTVPADTVPADLVVGGSGRRR